MQEVFGECDEENEDERIDETTSCFSLFTLEYMHGLQVQDPELAELITYLSTDDLPVSDESARKSVMKANQRRM